VRVDDQPQLRLTADELRRSVIENLFDLFRATSRLPGGELEEGSGLSRHHAFPTNPMFKGVWKITAAAGELDDALDESLAWLEQRAAPFAFFTLGVDGEADDLRARLEARGLAPWELDAPGMAAELKALDWDAAERVPREVEIRTVRSDDELEDFGRTFVAAFEIPDWAGEAWVDATRAVGIDDAAWRIYVGYLGGEPVATNILFVGAGVAAVFGVGTVAPARGRGIGAAITLAGYRDALELGYRYGVLFSTELGLSVYRRLGFVETGSTVTRYFWSAD
jgi:GNAT superfamily N-acetyltransferase